MRPHHRSGPVGDLGSAHWSQSRYGTKIKRVMEHRTAGSDTLIIDERTFVTSVIGGE